MNVDTRKHCEYFGFIENHEDESILLFHSCSTNIDEKINDINEAGCNELHIGNTPRSIMTRLNSLGRVIEEIFTHSIIDNFPGCKSLENHLNHLNNMQATDFKYKRTKGF